MLHLLRFVLILLFAFIPPCFGAVQILDEGISQGWIVSLDYVGAGVVAGVVGHTGTITIAAGGTTDGDLILFDDDDANFTATNVDDAISEFDNVLGAGVPNQATGKVDWSQLLNVPAGFADGTDDGGGGGNDIYVEEQDVAVANNNAGDITLDFLGADFDTGLVGNEVNLNIAAALTRDAEWDTAAEINAATTDADFLTAEVDALSLHLNCDNDPLTDGLQITMPAATAQGLYIDGATNDGTSAATGITLNMTRDVNIGNGNNMQDYAGMQNYLNLKHDAWAILNSSHYHYGAINRIDDDSNVLNNSANNRYVYEWGALNWIDNDADYDTSSTGQFMGNFVGTRSLVDVDAVFTDSGANTPANQFLAVGNDIKVDCAPTLTSGTLNPQLNGTRIEVIGTATGSSIAYGLFIIGVSGCDTNYGIYDASGADWYQTGDITVAGNSDLEGYVSIGNGSALDASFTTIIDRDFTDSGNTNVAQLSIGGIITKDTFAAANSVAGLEVRPQGIILDAVSPPVTASAVFTEPIITEVNAGAALIAATVYIANAPTEGTSNYALYVAGETYSESVFVDNVLALGADDNPADLYIHDAGSITMYEDSDDFSASVVCADGKAEWQFQDDVNIGAVADAENFYVHNGGIMRALSAGDDKYITISHNDTNGLITSSDGAISFDNENLTTTGTLTGATIDTGSGAVDLGDAAVANGDTNSVPTGDQVYDFVSGGWVAGAGVFDLGGATSLELPNSAAPTVDATGKIGIDTNIITQGMLEVYLTSALAYVVATTDTPSDNEVPTYDAAGGTIQWEAGGAGGGAIYREITLLPESAVLDDTVPPAITIIESTGTGTPRFRVADFDAAADEIIYYSFVMPSDYTASSDPIVDIYWFTNGTGADEDCIWAVEVSATTAADADSMIECAMDADIATVSDNCDANEANRLIKSTVTLTYATYMDSAAAGDVITIRIFRDADDSVGDADNDGLSSDARLQSVHIKIPRS